MGNFRLSLPAFHPSGCPLCKGKIYKSGKMVKEITSQADWDALMNGEKKLVVVDFFADWCGPCKAIAPKVIEMEKEFTDVVFVKVNVDNMEDLAAQQEISAMPTFRLFKDGQKIAEVVGANEAKIRAEVEKHK